MEKLEIGGETEGNITSLRDFHLSTEHFTGYTLPWTLADCSKDCSKKVTVMQKLLISALVFWPTLFPTILKSVFLSREYNKPLT